MYTLLRPEFAPVWGKHRDWQKQPSGLNTRLVMHLNRDVTICSNVAACLTCRSEQLRQWCRTAIRNILSGHRSLPRTMVLKVFSEGRKWSAISAREIRGRKWSAISAREIRGRKWSSIIAREIRGRKWSAISGRGVRGRKWSAISGRGVRGTFPYWLLWSSIIF